MEKTYVFDANNSSLDSTALLASLMQNKGVDPNLMAMLTNASKNQDAWGGNGCWFIWVILMFWLWGGQGNGLFGNRGIDGIPNQLNNDFGREILLQAIGNNGQAIGQLATTLNCDVNALQGAISNVQNSVQSIASQLGMTGQQVINAIQQGNCQIGNQMAQCCCDIKDSITRTNYENQLSNVNQTNTLQNAINFVNSSVERGFSSTAYATANQTCELKNAIAAQTNLINDKFCQLEMRDLQNRINTQSDIITQLRGQIDNDRQTAQLYSAISPIQTKVNEIANKQPNTIPVQYPNITAVNNTPCIGNMYGYNWGTNSFWN